MTLPDPSLPFSAVVRARGGLRISLALVALVLFGDALTAQTRAPAADAPQAVGISSERLSRLSSTLQQYVDEGRVSGVVALIARDGRIVYHDSVGRRDVEKNAPMQRDTIFRIASMSKAITSVAIMHLVEEGKLLLNDPVSKHIPAFKTTTVALAPPENAIATSPAAVVAATRPITIRDLLTHTAGISYGSTVTKPLYLAAGFDDWYFADSAEPIGVRIEKLAALPFDAQPGEEYVYGYATDILGHIVEKASGLTLDEFLRTRILVPLKMMDTHFFLPSEKRDRLATVYSAVDGKIERAPDKGRFQGAYVDGPRTCFSGGAGLVSTASDYARFLQMLLNGGELEGVRILGPKTVELMTSNHTGTLYANGRFGFGLGFEVVEHLGRGGRHGSVGEFSWGGAYFTRFWVDPHEKLVAVFMAQLLPSGGLDLQDKFRALVYQAIEVSGRVAPVPARTMRAPARQQSRR